jgi:hypothetical protein
MTPQLLPTYSLVIPQLLPGYSLVTPRLLPRYTWVDSLLYLGIPYDSPATS